MIQRPHPLLIAVRTALHLNDYRPHWRTVRAFVQIDNDDVTLANLRIRHDLRRILRRRDGHRVLGHRHTEVSAQQNRRQVGIAPKQVDQELVLESVAHET